MKTKLAPHLYIGDGIPDHRGEDRCTTCGLPQQAPAHRLPAQTAEANHRDAAVLGEKPERA